MRKEYVFLTDEEIESCTKQHLGAMYNEAVTTIWDLRRRIQEQMDENDRVWTAFDDLYDKYYG